MCQLPKSLLLCSIISNSNIIMKITVFFAFFRNGLMALVVVTEQTLL
jgi:hypothetical protein